MVLFVYSEQLHAQWYSICKKHRVTGTMLTYLSNNLWLIKILKEKRF